MSGIFVPNFGEAIEMVEPWFLDWHKLENHADYPKSELVEAAENLACNETYGARGFYSITNQQGKQAEHYKFWYLLPEYGGIDSGCRMIVYGRRVEFIDRGGDDYEVHIEPCAIHIFPGTPRDKAIESLEKKHGKHFGSHWDEDWGQFSSTQKFKCGCHT